MVPYDTTQFDAIVFCTVRRPAWSAQTSARSLFSGLSSTWKPAGSRAEPKTRFVQGRRDSMRGHEVSVCESVSATADDALAGHGSVALLLSGSELR